MTARSIPGKTLGAVLVALVAALIARAVLQIRFAANGMAADVAADLSYLVVPIVLAVILFPLWHSEKRFVASQFRRIDLSWRIALSAIAIGMLLRLSWWSQLVMGGSFGIYRSTDPDAIVGPTLAFQCPAPTAMILGILVMTFLVPIIEEIVHRSYVVSALRKRGFLAAVLVSALIFAIFHRFSSMPFAFLAGAVFGVQYLLTNSLWSSVISHATINGLIQLDWRCLSGQWNPRAEDLPLLVPGVISTVLLFCSVITILYLLRRMAIGAQHAPR